MAKNKTNITYTTKTQWVGLEQWYSGLSIFFACSLHVLDFTPYGSFRPSPEPRVISEH